MLEGMKIRALTCRCYNTNVSCWETMSSCLVRFFFNFFFVTLLVCSFYWKCINWKHKKKSNDWPDHLCISDWLLISILYRNNFTVAQKKTQTLF